MDELEAKRPLVTAVRFGEFRLDPARAELTRAGVPVALRPKTYSLLALFVGCPRRVLGKDELLAALWPKSVVSEASVTQCVTELRAALGDSGESLIKTVPRQGYRFDAHVVTEAAAAPAWDKPSIAVLPFQNLSGDPEQEYFADGMVDELITALSRVRSLVVIARSSSFTYKGKSVDVKQVGRALGVRYVLEGSVRKVANNLRFFGQLVDASAGTQIWAERFEGTLKDIFDLHDRMTASVVGAVVPKLQQAEVERAKRKPTGSLDAYDLYLRGVACYYEFGSREANAEALRLFKRAIEIDPGFALAYAMAADCYVLRKGHSWMIDPPSEVSDMTKLARRAVELDKDDAFVLGACGWALAYVAHDLDAGSAIVDRALELNPNLADAWLWGGWTKIWLGEPDEAISRLTRAMRLSPLEPRMPGMQFAIAHAYFFTGRYDEAALWAAKSLQARSDLQGALRIDAASNALAGRLAQARKSVARLRELYPNLSLSKLRTVLGPYRRAEDVANYEMALRRAGLRD